MKVEIKSIDDNNKSLVRQLFIDNWSSDIMITKGLIHKFDDLDGFVAITNNEIVGVLTFKTQNESIELISLDSFKKKKGIGTLLLNRLVEFAKNTSVKRLCLITTNDNLNALKFYQKRNWTLKSIYKDAVIEARKLKPSIPMTGYDGIEIRHEIELEYEPEK